MESKGYVDIHSHIIPGVDDGARTMEESVDMLKVAYEQGVRTMYATPHFGSGKEKYDKGLLLEKYEVLKEEALGIGEEGIKLILGNELYYNHSSVEALQKGEAFTMGGTRYVLVEFAFGIGYSELYKGLQRLLNEGYRPILAHIERYYCLFRQTSEIMSLRELGVLFQINVASVIPRFSGEASFCRKLIKEGYIHFLGSDCHHIDWRPPVMSDGIEVLSKKTPDKYMDRLLYKNPCKFENNEII